jgi:uncharacterized membrane protein
MPSVRERSLRGFAMKPTDSTNGRMQVLILVTLQALLLWLVVLFTLPAVYGWHIGDLQTYFNAARSLSAGQLPYRDFTLEYPPLALVPFVLPQLALGSQAYDVSGYAWRFLLQNTLISSLIALGIALVMNHWRPQRRLLALALYALLVGLNAPVLPWRYDLFPALLTLLGLLCVLRGYPGLAGLWIGFGIAAKLYPIVLLPVFAAYYLASGDRRALIRLTLGGVAAVAIALLPFALTAPGDLIAFLRYHEQRGLQIESLPAGAIILAHVLGQGGAGVVFNYGALHLVSPLADVALKWLPLAFVAVFGAVLASCTARFRDEQTTAGTIDGATLANACVAALLGFVATNKVFSPQYMIWLLPFAPLLRLRHTAMIVVICAITIAIFPFDYQSLIDMHPFPVLLLNLRNLLVVMLLLWLLLEQLPALARVLRAQPRELLQRWRVGREEAR